MATQLEEIKVSRRTETGKRRMRRMRHHRWGLRNHCRWSCALESPFMDGRVAALNPISSQSAVCLLPIESRFTGTFTFSQFDGSVCDVLVEITGSLLIVRVS